jgi:hypothetical protein
MAEAKLNEIALQLELFVDELLVGKGLNFC